MADYRVGDEVLAPWLADGFLYPAVVVSREGDRAHVAYFDGQEEDVGVSSLRQAKLGPGISVLINWRGRGKYYRGTIVTRLGPALAMLYDDGERGWTTIAQCRIAAAVVDALAQSDVACSFCGVLMDEHESRCGGCGAPRMRR